MSRHRRGAILMLVVAMVCLVLDKLFGIPVGPVAVFVVGLGSGLWIGEEMSRDEAKERAAAAVT